MSKSNKKKGDNFETLARYYFKKIYGVEFKKQTKIKIGYRGGKMRFFDLVNEKQKIVIECKNYIFSESNNIPATKISVLTKEVYKLSLLPKEYEQGIMRAQKFKQKRCKFERIF